MIKLTQNTKTFGDCTAGYEVALDKRYSVKEFIDEVLTKKEWGKIRVIDDNENPFCEYKENTIVVQMPTDYLDEIVIKATAHGGWSNMDYNLFL